MKIKEIIETIKTETFSGAVLIKENNKVVIESCNDYANRTEKILNNINTKFAIASGTKFFTALGVMKLVDLNKLTLDDPAYIYLSPNFEFYDKSVTIKHLLTHTSGIPDYYDEDIIQKSGLPKLKKAWYELKKPSDYLDVMPKSEMLSKPGAEFKYNNSAFVFLAIIIEKITGDYYSWIEKEIFYKSSMKDTGFYKFDQLPANTANGYIELDNGTFRTNIYDLPIRGSGDGGLYTTVSDMMNFWEEFRCGNIVSKEMVKEILYPHYHSDDVCYGLGVWLIKKKDKYYPLIIGEDPGVSFESGVIEDVIYAIVSNTQYGAWNITKLLDK